MIQHANPCQMELSRIPAFWSFPHTHVFPALVSLRPRLILLDASWHLVTAPNVQRWSFWSMDNGGFWCVNKIDYHWISVNNPWSLHLYRCVHHGLSTDIHPLLWLTGRHLQSKRSGWSVQSSQTNWARSKGFAWQWPVVSRSVVQIVSGWWLIYA